MATRRKARFLVFRLFISLLLASLTLSGFTFAEVVTDGSLGGPKGPVGSGTVPGVGTTTYHIADTLGKRLGQNLFHSFDKFSVLTNESATFTGPGDIRNVVSRVTGGSYSSIDGTLRSTIQGANLYFLNPWGVFFGPNASLDVKGSFHVSTADYLRFEDGLTFHSAPGPADQVLSTASPVAFGFLNAAPAPVNVVQSFLEVPGGETLSVIGGNIELSAAFLNAPGGRINLASMASPGEVIPSPAGEVPDLQVRSLNACGTISFHGSLINVSGAPVGVILIRAGRLVLDHGSWVLADTYGDASGGTVDILTGSLDSSGGSSLSSDSQGIGDGGQLVVKATDWVRLNGSYLSSASWASGDAGSIALSTPYLLIENEAMIYGDSFGDGKGGDVSIVSGKLTLMSGGSISSSAYGQTGNGGNLSITATESLSISGRGPYGLYSSLENRTTGAGNAGRIQVLTPLLHIGESGSISAETLGTGRAGDIDVIAETVNLRAGGRISNGAFGTTGKGGNISIRASDSVTISDTGAQDIPSGIFTFAAAAGEAGSIILSAPHVVLSNGASIGADTVGDGRAGNIELTVRQLALSGGATISSGSIGGSGGGGNIHVTATDGVSLSGLFSDISTSTEGVGRGGDIEVSSSTLTLQNQAAIYADTIGSGQGGNVGINVASLTMGGGSRVSSSSYGGTGDGGQVTVQAGHGHLTDRNVQRSLLGLLRRGKGRRHPARSKGVSSY